MHHRGFARWTKRRETSGNEFVRARAIRATARLRIDLYQQGISEPASLNIAGVKLNSTADRKRPDIADEPGPGQESVWDYPRPPAIRWEGRLIEIRDGDARIAYATRSIKVMETASPPTFYLPRDAVDLDLLSPMPQTTYCEWKGTANYWALKRNPTEAVAWCYERPRARFDDIAKCIAFYPGRVECRLGGELVRAQAGRFYGGWITPDVVGPFKGEPGTGHW